MTVKSRWAHDFNKKLQELFRFEFDLPAVFIDTFHRKQSEHEVDKLLNVRNLHTNVKTQFETMLIILDTTFYWQRG